MSVHYKFKSALEYDTVTFDGLHISVKDLKNAIVQQKRIGKSTDFDLQVTNAQTKEIYEDENTLIPKNTSLLIARIPIISQNKSKSWEGYGGDATPPSRVDEGPIAKAVDLSNLDVPEDDKIRAMMSQSTQDYDPSNYMKIRGANQMGAVPPNYRCYKCHQSGHWIKDCPLSQGPDQIEIKKSTGIPRSFMVPVEGPQVPGAMMTPNGSYAVPVLDHQTYSQKQPPPPPIQEEKPEIPEDLLCSICSDLLTDAVMIPCCGNSFCDECIRSSLLESEDHECPDCHDRDISPGTLIPNRFLRNSVANFKNTTGYVKTSFYKPPPKPPVIVEDVQTKIPEKVTTSPAAENVDKESETSLAPKKDVEEKTVISEADSTEPPKSTPADTSKDDDLSVPAKTASKSPTPEGPPGVSPKHENKSHHKSQPITNISNTTRSYSSSSSRYVSKSSHERSPRKQMSHHHSPSYSESRHHMEERPGTPTVDEPGMGGPMMGGPSMYSSGSVSNTYSNAPPPGIMPPMMGMGPSSHMQQGPPPPSMSNQYGGGPPPSVYQQQSQGPMPNFRLPPPNSGSAPYMPPGPYNVPPRPMYDSSRPPIQGPPGYPSTYNMSQRFPRGRDYIPSQPRGYRGKSPPGVIDDPLEAFNRMLREKDERERRAKWRKGRNYSRSSSRSRSRSRSRSPAPRARSRSPRRRFSRSRSRSFSISRSRSRSFSPSLRGSPSPFRDFSPRISPRRGAQTRYRSPIRSPPRYRYKDPAPPERHRDRDVERDRDRDRDRDREREFSNRTDRGYSRERERERHYYDSYDRDRSRPKHLWNQGPMKGPPEGHYPPPEMQAPYISRYPPRDNYPPPYVGKNEPPHHVPSFPSHGHQQPVPPMHVPSRRYDDVVPPGTEQPPVPGLEPTPRFDERFSYEQEKPPMERYESPVHDYRDGKDVDKRNERERERDKDRDRDRDREHDRDRERDRERDRDRERERDRNRDAPPSSDKADKHKERRHERYSSRSPDKSKKETSDDEKSKRSKEKKKKKEKKESDKKKKKERKEKKEHDKHRKIEEKEKRSKESSKTVDHNQEVTKTEKVETKKVVEEEKIVTATHKEMSPRDDTAKKETSEEKTTAEEPQTDLYGDILTEGIDNNVVANYVKTEEKGENEADSSIEEKSSEKTPSKDEEVETKTLEVSKEEEDSEKDILELHTNEAELKTELEGKSDLLVPLPEKSRWEMDEDGAQNPAAPAELNKLESKTEKSGKVTNEVLKRAENAIFAKAINAIRPIEIKKISLDRAKLYSGEKDKKVEDMEMRNIHVTISSNYGDDIHPPGTEPSKHLESAIQPPVRLSVKERLGCKVDDLDRIVKVDKAYDRNRSCSLSPLSKRASDSARNYSQGERRVEVEERRRHEDKARHDSSSKHSRSYRATERADSRNTRREPRRDDYSSSRRDSRDTRRDRDRDRDYHRRDDSHRRDEHKSTTETHHRDEKKSTTHTSSDDPKGVKRKRTRSKSGSRDKRERSKSKKKDKRQKKDKVKKHKKDESEDAKDKGGEENKDATKQEGTDQKPPPKPTTDRRKPTLDESNFEPDYDLESESEKDDDKDKDKEKPEQKKPPVAKSPEPEKKKMKLEEKKKGSSSSDSSDSSSAEERKKKKHKKHKKKKPKKDSSSSSSESESETTDEDRSSSKKKKKHKKKIKKKKKSKHK